MPNYRWSLKAARPKPGYPKQINTLADHLKARRLDLSLTQKEVAARLAVDADSVRNWEAGRSSPAIRWLPAIIAFLGDNPLPQPATIGKQIRRERIARGRSRRRLAQIADVDEATVRRVEADTCRVARKLWCRVRAVLGGVRPNR